MAFDAFPSSSLPMPAGADFFMLDTTGSSRAYSGKSYEAIFAGAQFGQIISFVLDGIGRGLLSAFIARQQGLLGRFRCPVYDYTRLGGQAGEIVVSGADQVGSNLVVNGLGGTDPVIKIGDLCLVDERYLHIVADNVNAASGTIPLIPELYKSPTNGSLVKINGIDRAIHIDPVWQLVDNDVFRRVTRPPLISNFTISMITAPKGAGIGG